jgi:hypothetical protein
MLHRHKRPTTHSIKLFVLPKPMLSKRSVLKNLVTQTIQKIGIKTMANLTYQEFHNIIKSKGKGTS